MNNSHPYFVSLSLPLVTRIVTDKTHTAGGFYHHVRLFDKLVRKEVFTYKRNLTYICET